MGINASQKRSNLEGNIWVDLQQINHIQQLSAECCCYTCYNKSYVLGSITFVSLKIEYMTHSLLSSF